MEKTRFFLRCLKSGREDILLPDGKKVFLGRGPVLKIKNPRLSREQLAFTARYELNEIRVDHVGANPSKVGDQTLERGESTTVSVGSRIQFLQDENEDEYQYLIKSTVSPKASPIKDEHGAKDRMTGVKRDHNGTKKHWSAGLLASMNDPELQVHEDDQIVIIKDKYPKARHHYLVLPRENVPNLKALTTDHIDLVMHMHKEGRKITEKYPDCQFRLGYHAVPSMSQMHLHVISQDFNSPCLKTKKHWNSFTTEYFMDADSVLQQLKDTGHVTSHGGKDLLEKQLVCHKCSFAPKNMPELKKHLQEHY